MTKDFDERNAEKSRAVCEVMDRENGRRKLSERERQILDMWPRYEDTGECVWFGDEVDFGGAGGAVSSIELQGEGYFIVHACDGGFKVGDTVWHDDGSEWIVEEMNRYGARCFDGDRRRTFDPRCLTHTRPDSWERLEEDVNTIVTGSGMYLRLNDYCNKRDLGGDDVMVLTVCDIVRRAKKLAGVD